MNELVYGIHSVKSVLDVRPEQILRINIICKPWDIRFKSLVKQINESNINLRECTRQWLDNKVRGALHQGIIAEVLRAPDLMESDLLDFLINCNTMPLLLVLDGITDPHNLGACLRSAEASGTHIVIITKRRSARMNAVVRKVSSGSAERVPLIRVISLSRTLRLLKKHGIWIVGTVAQSSCNIFNAKLIGPLALVIGSEEFGIRRLTKEYCDEIISIPMVGSISSLNVSVATGICLFEAVRQREYQD